MHNIECFKIKLLSFDKEDDIFDLKKGKTLLQIPCLKPYFTKDPSIILADPFLFVHKERLYLFYESKGFKTPGVIKMINTKDLKTWSKPVTVLKEPFHLSYPFVFEDNGKIYMIPETCADGSVRLYEAENEDLNKFSFRQRILIQPKETEIKMGYSDSSVFKKEGIYFLMTMLQYSDAINTLELYTADSLTGPYSSHPSSPIIKSQKIGRDAGGWINYQGRLLRVSQDCVNRYGDNVNVSEILELSPTSYKEKLVKEKIIPTDTDFYKEGGHQFNVVNFHDEWIVSTDAKEYHPMILHRIIQKLKRL